MALSTLEPYTQEQLAGRLGKFLRFAVNTKIVRRTIHVDRSLSSHQLSHKLIKRFVLAKTVMDPAVVRIGVLAS